MRAILTYHSIDPSGSRISLCPDVFEDHVRWLASGQVQVTTLERLLLLPPASNAVALTFDDGYENFESQAWPRLREHGLPATLFVVTDYAGRTNAWGARRQRGIPELRVLGWDALVRLAEQGVAVGSHGRTHMALPQADDRRLAAEVAGSAEVITARIGVRPSVFAYPFGAVSDRCRSVAGGVYDLACTTKLRALGRRPDTLLLPRLDAYYWRTPGQLEGWGSAGFARRLKWRNGLRTVRAVWQRAGARAGIEG